MPVTKILEYIGFNLEDQESDKDYIGIRNNAIIHIIIINTKGVLTHKPPKKKEGPQVNKIHLSKEKSQFWKSLIMRSLKPLLQKLYTTP